MKLITYIWIATILFLSGCAQKEVTVEKDTVTFQNISKAGAKKLIRGVKTSTQWELREILRP